MASAAFVADAMDMSRRTPLQCNPIDFEFTAAPRPPVNAMSWSLEVSTAMPPSIAAIVDNHECLAWDKLYESCPGVSPAAASAKYQDKEDGSRLHASLVADMIKANWDIDGMKDKMSVPQGDAKKPVIKVDMELLLVLPTLFVAGRGVKAAPARSRSNWRPGQICRPIYIHYLRFSGLRFEGPRDRSR